MAGNILDFNTLAEATTASPPAGYTKPAGSDAARISLITGVKLFTLSGATQTIWYDNQTLSGSVISAVVVFPVVVSGSSAGACLIDASGNGLMVTASTGTNNFRIFAVANGQLSGGALMTAAVTPVSNASVELRKTGNDYEVFQNTVKVGTTYTSGAYSPTFAGAVSRGGQLRSLESVYTAAQSIDTITSPIIPEATVSGNHTGFATGAGTISTPNPSGTTISNITFAASTYSGTYATPVHLSPFPLFGTSYTHTFTIGAQTSTIISVVNQPAGFDLIPVTAPVLDDLTYITANFNTVPITGDIMLVESGKLATADGTGYWTAPAGAPIIAQVVHQIASTGVTEIYEFTFTEAGVVPGSGRTITAIGLTASGITARGITAVGL